MPTMVPMASGDMSPAWPMPDIEPSVPTSGGRRFGALRAKGARYHAGVDIFAPEGTIVVAPEAGTLVRQYKFNGPRAFALLLQSDTGVVLNLSEVEPRSWLEFGRSVGTPRHPERATWVDKGEPIARIGVNPKGSTMLHFEAYTRGTRANQRWKPNSDPPRRLLDPTNYLLEAAGNVVIPDVKTGDGGVAVEVALALGIPLAMVLTWAATRKKARRG